MRILMLKFATGNEMTISKVFLISFFCKMRQDERERGGEERGEREREKERERGEREREKERE